MAKREQTGMDYLVTLPRRVVTVYIPLVLFLIVLLFPFYWMVITTFKPNRSSTIWNVSIPSGSFRRRSITSRSCCSPPISPNGSSPP